MGVPSIAGKRWPFGPISTPVSIADSEMPKGRQGAPALASPSLLLQFKRG